MAIDITSWLFYPTPWKNYSLRLPKDAYPGMVSGLKDSHMRGYKFATLTIIGKDTPIVLAVEPVKQVSGWEGSGAGTNVGSRSR
ncbi:hypothetical protein [Haloarcula sp. 1CSR25-25]|uniref:hypothetical protein n=1 Tax=Haloarcula sp. 1CSR25-25 TaxID=2862545 RepID=UPI002894BBA0|nr:hypothetical protein [Haloarcula sp. 1CSR25-25]MDT3437285.1 hypothetical protein [Haloarcula sp. 1CSR25-25]